MTQPELRIGTPRHAFPFSRGLVVESLVNAGASGAVAAAAARRVEQNLRLSRRTLVSPDELQALMAEVARDLAGEDVADAAAAQTPAFVDILVTAKKGDLPFSRGVLARTLEDAGLTGREAYATASAVDVELRKEGVRRLSAEDIDNRTERALASRYGEHLRLTYRYLRRNRGKLGVISSDSTVPTPFSKGILSQSMLAAGVTPDVARKVARVTQRDLRGSEDRVVTRSAIRAKVEALLRDEVGPDVGARYRLLRVIRRPPRPVIVLLGGVSGTGKSFFPGRRNCLPAGHCPRGQHRFHPQVMRATVSPALLPTLHASTFNAWEALFAARTPRRTPSKQELLAGFRDQVQQVNVGLGAVVARSVQEGSSLVLEGVHLRARLPAGRRLCRGAGHSHAGDPAGPRRTPPPLPEPRRGDRREPPAAPLHAVLRRNSRHAGRT